MTEWSEQEGEATRAEYMHSFTDVEFNQNSSDNCDTSSNKEYMRRTDSIMFDFRVPHLTKS